MQLCATVRFFRPSGEGGDGIYIDTGVLIEAAAAVGALMTLLAVLRKIYLWFARQEEQNALQWRAIHKGQEEQTLICYGVRACLMGLIEQGCNGPCKDALGRLDKHLNEAAHCDEGSGLGETK